MAATQLAQMIILATDTVMLGHFSKEALAAGALGNTVYFLVWLLGSGLPMAVSPVIAHVQGKQPARSPRDVRPGASAERPRDQEKCASPCAWACGRWRWSRCRCWRC